MTIKSKKRWARNLRDAISEGDDLLVLLGEFADDVGLDLVERRALEYRYRYFSGSDESVEGVYFLLFGEPYPSRAGCAWA